MDVSQEHRERVDTLVKVAIAFLSRSKSLSDEMMTIGVQLIADLLNVSRFSIWRNIPAPDGLRTSQIYFWVREEGGSLSPLPIYQNIAYNSFGLPLEEYFSRGDSINIKINQLPESAALKTLEGKAVMAIPVFLSDSLWGFAIFADAQYEHQFDDVTVEMMRSAAFLVANTVIRNEMERELRNQDELNRAMFDVAPIGLTIFDECGTIIDCNDSILQICEVTKQYHIENFDDLFPEYQPDGSPSREKIRECMQRALKGEKIVMEWMFSSPTGEPIPCEMTLLRVLYNGKYFGVGYSYDLRNIKTMEADIERLESVVYQVYDDPLTGIKNRRYFDEHLKRILQSLSRTKGTLSFLLIDIDYFKNFNDTYGHIAGDKCLKIVAETLMKTVLRIDDFVARYGGEEFAVVLPNTDAEGAKVMAEKLRQNIQDCSLPHRASKAANIVTISIGVTTGQVDNTQSPEDYIKRADEMLYLSKQNGRNRYSFAPMNEDFQ